MITYFQTLLRIPGVGLKSADRLISARKFNRLNFNDLNRMVVVLKRARYFITCQGCFLEKLDNDLTIRQRLLAIDSPNPDKLELNYWKISPVFHIRA